MLILIRVCWEIRIMPRRKSAESLQKLCIEHACRNLNTLQDKARHLPLDLINDMYDKSVSLYKSTKSPVPLPVDFFFHAKTKAVYSLDYFDQPAEEVINKICQLCRNLKEIYLTLTEHIDRISTITMNNAHILLMDLYSSECSDHHLSIIGKNCLQLQCLYLINCKLITNEGMNCLPEKVISLNLPSQITLKGHLNVLKRLPNLKTANHSIGWNQVIERYAKILADKVADRTYEIEEMDIYLGEPTSYDIPNTVRIMFPKLSHIHLGVTFTLSNTAAVFLEAINCNLLTHLNLCTSADFVQIACHLCPLLEYLDIQVRSGNQMSNNRWIAKSKKDPLKNLRTLRVTDKNSNLSIDDLKLLLVNCQQLECLVIVYFDRLSDQVIYDVLAANPLKCLREIMFNICKPFSIESLCVFVTSLQSLMFLNICSCRHLLPKDEFTLKKLVSDINWNLKLKWSYNV